MKIVPYYPLRFDPNNPKEFEQALNEDLRVIAAEQFQLPNGDTRDALINDDTGPDSWDSYNLDTFHFLGTATWDGSSIYEIDLGAYSGPPLPFTVTDVGGVGPVPPDLNKPYPGAFFYFRADATNTGPAQLWLHKDLPEIYGVAAFDIIKPDGSDLSAGDIPEGAFVAVVWDSILNGNTPPQQGEQKYRLLGILVPNAADLIGIVELDNGGTGSDLSSTGPGVLVQATAGANITVQQYIPSIGFPAQNKEAFTINAGQPVKIHSSGSGVVLAQADVYGNRCEGLAAASITAGSTGYIITHGVITISNWSVPTGGSATLTAGTQWFLAAGSAGLIATSPPTGASNIIQYVGRQVTSTSLLIQVARPIQI